MGLFGFGDATCKVDIQNDGVFGPGDKVEGTATFTLNKDVNANGIIAKLHGDEPSRQGPLIIYQSIQNLDGPKTYLKSSSPLIYKFSFVMPSSDTISKFKVPVYQSDIIWYVTAVMDKEGILKVFDNKNIKVVRNKS